MTDIVPGKTTFRHVHADSLALWGVKRHRGDDIWECAIEDDEDYAGTMRVFTSQEIAKSVKSAELRRNLDSRNRDFWRDRKPGEIFHYANSSRQFVRCEVAVDPDRGFALKPVALVGRWGATDLPRWWDSGHFKEGGYWVAKVRTGELFQPNESSLWEIQRSSGLNDDSDPTEMRVIDITNPVPTVAQAEAAEMLAVVDSVHELLDMPRESDNFAEIYRTRLAAIAALIADKIDLECAPPPSAVDHKPR
jgi:hypothetical protein